VIEIRQARQSDVPKIAELYVETWRTTYAGTLPDKVLVNMSVERQSVNWARAIQRGREIIMVAADAEAGVVGVGSAGPNRDVSSTYAGEVYTLYVLPDFQDGGIGERLLAHLFRALLEQGKGAAVIWVLAPNPSRFFYEAMGGIREGDRDEKLWGTTLKELAYVWQDLGRCLADGRPQIDRQASRPDR